MVVAVGPAVAVGLVVALLAGAVETEPMALTKVVLAVPGMVVVLEALVIVLVVLVSVVRVVAVVVVIITLVVVVVVTLVAVAVRLLPPEIMVVLAGVGVARPTPARLLPVSRTLREPTRAMVV